MMKRPLKILTAALAVIVLFTACKQLLDDPEDFLSYWASEAFVKDRSIVSAHRPDGAGVPCVGSSDNVLITLTAHNPKNFPFVMPSSSEPAGIVEFKELSHQPAAGADYELKQTGSGTLELTYKQDFLKRYEQGSAALNPTITLKAKDGRVFKQTYTFGIKSNTPPPKPKEIVLAKTKITGTETISYYVLCLQFDSAEMTKKVTIGSGTVPIHKDIAKITINDSPYTLLYKEDNSDFQKPAETFSIGSFIESGNVEILDSSSPDVPSGWVLYFKTGIQVQSTNPQTSYTITLSDNKGVVSDVFTAELKKKFKVTFDVQGGSPVPAQYIENNGKVTRPTDPTKTGYIFGGWYKNAACVSGQEWDFANEIVTGDITLYAKWNNGTGIQYKIEHYKENIDDYNYTIVGSDTQTSYGTTGASAAYTPKTYEGFTYESNLTTINGITQTSGNIAGDNSTVVKLYYQRKTINLKFKLAGGNISGNTGDVTRSGKYGTTFTAPANPVKTGYTFSSWDPALPSPLKFPAEDATYTAQWTAGAVSYKVEHYQEKLDGTYPSSATETENKPGTTGQIAVYTPKAYEGFTYESNLTTINGITQTSGNIAGDNSTVVKLYYQRKTINLKFKLAGGNISGNTGDVTRSGKYGAPLTVPSPQLQGKTLSGWSPALPSPPTFPAEDATYTAQWTANTYYVHFYGNGNTGGSMSDQTFTYGQSQQLSANGFTKTGHTFDGWAIIAGGSKVYDNQQSVINLTDVQNGTVNLYAVWKIETYTVRFSVAGGKGTLKGEYGGQNETAQNGGGIKTLTNVPYGSTVSFKATADTGWEVESWEVYPGNFASAGGIGAAIATATLTVDRDKTVTVKFKPGEFNLAGGPDAWKRLKEEAAKTEGSHTIVINGEITATTDQDNNGKISIRRELIIKSSGSSASLNANNLSGIFNVDKKLTLENITLKNGTEPGERTGAGAYVNKSTLIMKGSSAITNCSAHKGGGVYINNGTLIMQGSSTISSCTAADKGSGVYVAGTFEMKEDALVDQNNDVYLASGKSIDVTGTLTNTPAARITPDSYTDGRVLATGAAEKANFKVTPDSDGDKWRYKKVGNEIKFVPATLTVTFTEIKCVVEHDDGPNGEYYWTMKVDGSIVHKRPKNNLWVAGDNTTLPINKSFTRSFSYFPASIPVDIEIWEHDDSFDDHVGTTKAHLTYNYDDDQWKWAYDGGNWNTNPKRNEMSNPNVIIGDGGEEIFTEQYRTSDGDTDVTIKISWKE